MINVSSSLLSDLACAHCGLPVPCALAPAAGQEGERLQAFCCSGCRTVYFAIHEDGLGRFYDLGRELDERQPARTTDRAYTELDDPSFTETHVEAVGERHSAVELYLEGVHCASCMWLIERLPRVLEGVTEVSLDLRRSVARVVWDQQRVSLPQIARRLDRLGYPVHPAKHLDLARTRRAEDRRQLARLGIAGALAGNAMLFAFALWGGAFSGMAESHALLLRGVSLAFALLSVFGPGRVFLAGAWSAVRAGTLHMDVPVAVALLVGTGWGAANVARGTGEVYFESITAVVFLLLVGRWIQHRQTRSANDAVELLYSLTPSTARRLESGAELHARGTEVPVAALAPGDRVEVLAGETLPADGRLLAGRAGFDLATLTGESRPVVLSPGEEVHAGTLCLDGRVVLEVSRTGVESRLGQLMQLVERASAEKPKLVQRTDRMAKRFVAATLTAAALTALLWSFLDPARAVEQAVALLIVTCPCALGLATPLAFQAAIGRAARRGILIKGGEVLERLAGVGTLLLDKTGTLTEGRLRVTTFEGDESVGPYVAALEQQVAHGAARAILAELGPVPPGFRAEPGEIASTGIEGRVWPSARAEARARELAIGSEAWIRSRAEVPERFERAIAAILLAGESPVLIAEERATVAVLSLSDPLQKGAREAVEQLEALGWEPQLLSGDHPATVAAVALKLGLDSQESRGGVSPEAKLDAVFAARANGLTVMVGDGVNDAAALSAADGGVAVHGGAEASLRAADVFLSRPGIGAVVDLMEGARRTVDVVKRNLAVSLAYNVFAAGLAIAGVLHPLHAAALMPLSSLTVVTLSYRSRTFDAEPRNPRPAR